MRRFGKGRISSQLRAALVAASLLAATSTYPAKAGEEPDSEVAGTPSEGGQVGLSVGVVADEAGITDLVGSLSMPVVLRAGWSIHPSVSYSVVVADELRDSVTMPDHLFGGITLSYAF